MLDGFQHNDRGHELSTEEINTAETLHQMLYKSQVTSINQDLGLKVGWRNLYTFFYKI